jgi:hypothetical protein
VIELQSAVGGFRYGPKLGGDPQHVFAQLLAGLLILVLSLVVVGCTARMLDCSSGDDNRAPVLPALRVQAILASPFFPL